MSSHFPDCLFWLTDRNVFCILLFLLFVCFHWSWLWSSTLPMWIYHFIIITSLSFFFFPDTLKLLSFLNCTPVLWRLIFLYVPSFLATVLPAKPLPLIALLLWVEHCFLTSSSGFLLSCNFSGFDSIVTSDRVCGFYWKQSTQSVAYLMQKKKIRWPMNELLFTMIEVEVPKMCQCLRLSGRCIYQTNEPCNTSAGKS